MNTSARGDGMNGKLLRPLRSEQGSIFNVVLLIVVLLASVAMYSSMSTRTELRITNNEKLQVCAMYSAEAGIDLGRAALNDLKENDTNGWTYLLVNENRKRQIDAGVAVGTVARTFSDLTARRNVLADAQYAAMTDGDLDEVLYLLLSNGVETAEQTMARLLGGLAVKGGSFSLTIVDDNDNDGIGAGNNNPLNDDNDIVILISRGVCGTAEAVVQTEVRYSGGSGDYAQLHYNTESSGNPAGESAAAAMNIL